MNNRKWMPYAMLVFVVAMTLIPGNPEHAVSNSIYHAFNVGLGFLWGTFAGRNAAKAELARIEEIKRRIDEIAARVFHSLGIDVKQG